MVVRSEVEQPELWLPVAVAVQVDVSARPFYDMQQFFGFVFINPKVREKKSIVNTEHNSVLKLRHDVPPEPLKTRFLAV